MTRSGKHRFATIKLTTILWMVAGMVALLPLLPALVVNLQGRVWPLNLAVAAVVILGAVFAEVARHSETWGSALGNVLLAAILCFISMFMSLDNNAKHSEKESDKRKADMVAAGNASSQRSQWSRSRSEAAKLVGETAVDALQSELDAYIAKDSRRWQSTVECNPLQITAEPSREFCAEVSVRKGKVVAAKQRDEMDRLISTDNDKPDANKPPPTSLYPTGDRVAGVVLIFGVELSERSKKAVEDQKDTLLSIGLDIAAVFGPSAWMQLAAVFIAAIERSSGHTQRARTPIKARSTETQERQPIAEPSVALDDPFHRFVAECLEVVDGVATPAGEFWTAWLAWCVNNGIDPSYQRAFGAKMKARFAWERNNNRPRYLNVRVKQMAPKLRLVGGGEASIRCRPPDFLGTQRARKSQNPSNP